MLLRDCFAGCESIFVGLLRCHTITGFCCESVFVGLPPCYAITAYYVVLAVNILILSNYYIVTPFKGQSRMTSFVCYSKIWREPVKD